MGAEFSDNNAKGKGHDLPADHEKKSHDSNLSADLWSRQTADNASSRQGDNIAASKPADRLEVKPEDVNAAKSKLYDQSYNEKEHGPYHEFLAKNCTEKEIRDGFARLMASVESKLAASSHFGTEVKEATEAEVKRLYAIFQQIGEKKSS